MLFKKNILTSIAHFYLFGAQIYVYFVNRANLRSFFLDVR